MTLAIDATDDATEIVAHKTAAAWTVNKNQGCMPMVSALLMEIAEDWQTADKHYVTCGEAHAVEG